MRPLILLLVSCLVIAAGPATAQEDYGGRTAATPKLRFGLFGFAARAGIDFTGEDQLVLGYSLDLGDLYTERVRMRALGEIGLGASGDTYVVGGELTYRLVPDGTLAVPYLGGGLGLYSQEGCGDVAGCPALWLQFALGFEISIRAPMRWLVEYHAEDSLSHHRFFVGLTTIRGR